MGFKTNFLTAVLIGTVCSPALAGKSDDTVVVAFNKEVTTLDGLYSTARENVILSHLVSDQLVVLDPDTNEYLPALAESYSNVDERTVEFVLRDDIKFHDGSPVTAEDIVFSFEWVVDDRSKTKRGAFIRSWV